MRVFRLDMPADFTNELQLTEVRPCKEEGAKCAARGRETPVNPDRSTLHAKLEPCPMRTFPRPHRIRA